MAKVNILKNLLTIMKVGYIGKKDYVYCKNSKFILEILNLLLKQNIIKYYIVEKETNKIKLYLRYYHFNPLVKDFILINKPSLTIYSSYKELTYYRNKFHFFILSTDKGLISSEKLHDDFLKRNLRLGGQILFGVNYNTFKLN